MDEPLDTIKFETKEECTPCESSSWLDVLVGGMYILLLIDIFVHIPLAIKIVSTWF